MYLIKLKFDTPLIVQSEPRQLGDTDIIVHSDTLYSAIWSIWNLLYPEDKIFENDLFRNLFTISSAFPFYKEECFFPKPHSFMFEHDSRKSGERKKAKKISFVNKTLLEKIINNEAIELSSINLVQNIFSSDKELIINGKSDNKILEKKTKEHNLLNRFSDNSEEIFYETEIQFNKNCGMYFLLDIEENLFNKFHSVLLLFGDEGLGLSRSTGHGFFDTEFVPDYQIKVPASDCYLALSMFLPAKKEISKMQLNQSKFEIKNRGGWITNPRYMNNMKKNVRMFSEGSVFQTAEKLKGEIVNVKPDNCNMNIWRSGKLFSVPMKGGAK